MIGEGFLEGSSAAASLRLSRRFSATPERVFEAWTSPEVLRLWWAARPDWEGADAEVDLRPGGRYRLSMRDTESGLVHSVVGEYTEVRRPERLAYTWTWEGEPSEMTGSENTIVVVDFLETDEGTEVVLTHTGFASALIRDMHAAGWGGCLDNLSRRALADRGKEATP